MNDKSKLTSMRLSNVNPLDQNPLPAAPSVLVHTQSLLNEIKRGDNDTVRLLKIAALNTCPIVFTPVNNQEVNKLLADFNLDVASYYLQSNQYIVKCAYVEAAFSAENDLELAESFEAKQGYSLNDSMLMNSGYFHYHLSKLAPRSVNINTLLDILQVYHVKNRIFKAFPNYEIGQFFYDTLSTNRQIPNYKTLFSDFYNLKATFLAEAEIIENLLQSLYDRMLLMNKSVVELKYQSLKTVTNNASTEIMYHLSYFVILVTGSFDNLAWIINYIYGLGFFLTDANKTKVKLQNVYYPGNKSKEAYYKFLSAKAPVINAFLLTDKISCLIDFIYPLRDAVQHRNFIKPLTVGAKGTNDKLLIWFPEDVKTTLQRYFLPEEFGFQKEMSGLMNRDYYDIYIFSKRVHAEIIELINAVCGMIDLPVLLQISAQEFQSLADAKKGRDNDQFVGLKAQEAIVY